MEVSQLKSELDRTRAQQQQQKLRLLRQIRARDAEERLAERERQRFRAANLREVRLELQKVRKQMAKEFFEKKALVVEKLKELKQGNRSIEEIYKYTNDIILEEEDEDDTDDAKELKSTAQLNKSVDYAAEALERPAEKGYRSSLGHAEKKDEQIDMALPEIKRAKGPSPYLPLKPPPKPFNQSQEVPKSNFSNHFMVELIRRRQKEEIMGLIAGEEQRERDRLSVLKNSGPMLSIEQRAKLEAKFQNERQQAQTRIEKMMRQHESQLQEYVLASTHNSFGSSHV